MNNHLPVLLLAPLLGLSCCQKKNVVPEDQLPLATETGQNTAGCRVDGLPWTPRVEGLFGPTAISAQWFKSPATGGHGLRLSFLKSPYDESHVHARTHIQFFVPDVRQAGTFVLDQPANPRLASTNPAYGAFLFQYPSPGQELLTGPMATGRVVVTRFDSVARVVSGTFEFTAREAMGASAVQVRDGRFDCKF